jgi:hypothetical protein
LLLSAPLRGETVVLRTTDPAGDQKATFQPGRSYPGGDIRGAEITLKRLPAEASSSGSPGRDGYLYLPVSLKLNLNRRLTGGEVQLCIFINLPPYYIEHVISRDSFVDPRDGRKILLEGQHDFSFLLGLDPEREKEIADFKKSGLYQACFFFSPPEKRAAAFDRARQFDVRRGDSYLLPSSSAVYWHRLPHLKVSTSLTVMRVDNLKMGKIDDIYQDTLISSWSLLTGGLKSRPPAESSSAAGGKRR